MGKIFDAIMGKKEGETPNVEAAPSKDSWDDDINEATLENKKARSRKPKTASVSEEPSGAVDPKFSQLQSDIEKLITPENMAMFVQIPGAVMQVQTGFDRWEVPEREAMKAGIPLSVTAKYYSTMDPGKLAIAFSFLALSIIYGPRTMDWLKWRKSQQKSTPATKPELVKP